jgi:hypothetical protein
MQANSDISNYKNEQTPGMKLRENYVPQFVNRMSLVPSQQIMQKAPISQDNYSRMDAN